MKQILQNLANGQTELADIPCPQAKPGHLLIRTAKTLVSAGTERMLVEFGKANYLDKARQQPDKVRMVLDKIKTDGLLPTVDAVRSKLDQPLALGYCNAGTVLEVGAGVTGFTPGDRVVSNGKHAEAVCVPANLCAKIPDNVSDEAASFTVLGAIALQGIRLVNPTLGEAVVVTGLGLIGLVTVQLLRAHGCRVLGLDYDPEKLWLARRFGAETVNLTNGEDPLAAAQSFSRGRGVDTVIITASTQSSEPVHQAAVMCRKRGRIVLVGVTGLELSRADFYEKELTFQVSCSYGPGRYDPNYEEKGQDYPIGFVRWTEQRNFEAVLDMLACGALDVEPLISHRFPLERAAEAYELLAGDQPSLGILLEYPRQETDEVLRRTVALTPSPQPSPPHGARGKEKSHPYQDKAGQFTPPFSKGRLGGISWRLGGLSGLPKSPLAPLFQRGERVTRYSPAVSYPGVEEVKSPPYQGGVLEGVNVSFIGAGNYAGRVLIPAFKQAGAILHSVATHSGVNGVHFGRKYGFRETTTDTEALLADTQINTVVIATPHNSHARLVCQALQAGKHVFVEKPLCLTLEELEEIAETYQSAHAEIPPNLLCQRGEQNPRSTPHPSPLEPRSSPLEPRPSNLAPRTSPLLIVGFNRRFAPQIQKIKALLATVPEPKSFIMTVNAGDIPPDHWTQDPDIGGGRIIGEGCHFVDLLRFLAGSPIVEHQATSIGQAPGIAVRGDKTSFTLRFADGSFGTVHYLANGHKAFPKERLEVFCAGRVLQLDNFRKLKGYGWPGFKRMNLWRQDKGQAACAKAFVEAVRSGKPSPIPLAEIIEVSRLSIEIAQGSC